MSVPSERSDTVSKILPPTNSASQDTPPAPSLPREMFGVSIEFIDNLLPIAVDMELCHR